MEGVVVKEEPLDLDDQGEEGEGLYSESEDEGIVKENLDCELFHHDSLMSTGCVNLLEYTKYQKLSQIRCPRCSSRPRCSGRTAVSEMNCADWQKLL